MGDCCSRSCSHITRSCSRLLVAYLPGFPFCAIGTRGLCAVGRCRGEGRCGCAATSGSRADAATSGSRTDAASCQARRAAATKAAAQQAAPPGTFKFYRLVSALRLAAALAAVEVHITASGCEEGGPMDPGGERRADRLAVPCLAPCSCSCAGSHRVCVRLAVIRSRLVCWRVWNAYGKQIRLAGVSSVVCVVCCVCCVFCVFLTATLSSYTPRNLNSNTGL